MVGRVPENSEIISSSETIKQDPFIQLAYLTANFGWQQNSYISI